MRIHAAVTPHDSWLPRPGLAVVGVVLWVFAIGSTFGFVARGPTPTENALMIGGVILGLACHLSAIGVSLLRWQRQRRWPVVAALYGLALAAGVASWAWASGEEDRFLQANPGSFLIEPASGDSLRVQSAAGVWAVSLDACPGRGDGSVQGLGSRQGNGVADISYGQVPYYMRLHVEEQRMECLSPAPEAMRLRIGSVLDGGFYEVELRGDTLVSRQPLAARPDRFTTSATVPTDDAWRAFRATVDSLNLWRWNDRYDDPSVEDGTDWSVELQYLELPIQSAGSNAYPGPEGEPIQPEDGRAPPEFEAFTRAVERLTGQPFR